MRGFLNLRPVKLKRLLLLIFNAALNVFKKSSLTILSIYLRKSDSKPLGRQKKTDIALWVILKSM